MAAVLGRIGAERWQSKGLFLAAKQTSAGMHQSGIPAKIVSQGFAAAGCNDKGAPKGTPVPSGTVFAGMPAKKIKDISPELSSGEIDRIANNYVTYSGWFKED